MFTECMFAKQKKSEMDAGNPAEFVKTVFSRKFFERILLNIVIHSRLNLFENLTYGKI